jgi:hypothetical protein
VIEGREGLETAPAGLPGEPEEATPSMDELPLQEGEFEEHYKDTLEELSE